MGWAPWLTQRTGGKNLNRNIKARAKELKKKDQGKSVWDEREIPVVETPKMSVSLCPGEA